MKNIIFAIATLFAADTALADDSAITIGGVEMSNLEQCRVCSGEKKLGKWQGKMTHRLLESLCVIRMGCHIRGKYNHRANRRRRC